MQEKFWSTIEIITPYHTGINRSEKRKNRIAYLGTNELGQQHNLSMDPLTNNCAELRNIFSFTSAKFILLKNIRECLSTIKT